MRSTREWLIEHSKGDALSLFWRMFAWRERSSSRLAKNILTFFLSRMAHRHGGYIGKETRFAGRPVLPHGLHGVYISRFASVGRDCRIYQNVTIGEVDRKAPQIADRCLIGAGAVLVGDIRIGNDVKIGAGAVVSVDIEDGCTVVATPPRIIKKR